MAKKIPGPVTAAKITVRRSKRFVSERRMRAEVAAGAAEYTGPLTSADDVKTQGIKFIISGVISAVVDFSLTALFQFAFGLGTAGARTIGFIFGTLTAYMINRRWTFQAEPSLRRFIQVALLYTVTYVVNVLGYKWGFMALDKHLAAGLAAAIAFVVAQGTATVINFVVQRALIFKK